MSRATSHTPVTRTAWGERAAEKLSALAPSRVWRGVLAAVCGLLVYWTTAGGLFFYASTIQAALLVGVIVALVAAEPVSAALIGFGACLAGVLFGPVSFWVSQAGSPFASDPLATMAALVLAGAVASALSWAFGRKLLSARWVLWLAIALVIGNMWVTVVHADNAPTADFAQGVVVPSTVQYLDGSVPDALRHSDDFLYVWVYDKVRSGAPYYASFAAARPTLDPGSPGPSGALNVREPLLYVALAKLHSSQGVIVALLALATLAALSVTLVLRGITRPQLALPAVCAVASYAVMLGTSTQILYSELWAGLIGLVAFGAYAMSLTSARWRVWLGVAVGCALLAFLVRELAAFVLLAGALATLQAPAEQRITRLWAWGAGFAAAFIAYGAHTLAVRPYLSHAAGQSVVGRGGPLFALAGIVYNSEIWGPGMWAAVVLALLGIAGAVLMPRALRTFALVAVLVPFSAYLVAGNGAWSVVTKLPLNYWAVTILFTIYACIPAALTVLPTAAALRQRTDS